MDIIFGDSRKIVIDHLPDVGNVESSRRDIRGHEHSIAPSPESLERLTALRKPAPAV